MSNFFSPFASETIARVQGQDLELEEKRVREDRAKRRALRLLAQSKRTTYTTSELLQKLTGDSEAPAEDLKVPNPKKEYVEERISKGGFPPPPKAPQS